MVIGGVQVDLVQHEVRREHESCRLSPQEVAILLAFASRGHDVTLTRLELYREAWGYSREPRGRALDYAMRRLREKLGATNPSGSILGTVRGVGYRLAWMPDSGPTAAVSIPSSSEVPAPSLPAAPELVGRASLVAAGLELLLAEGALVSLLGPGGIGKSSVAAAIVHQIDGYTRVWVDLEAVAVGGAEDAISRALFPPGDSDDPFAERLIHLLAVRTQPIVLVLDGAERHLEALSSLLASVELSALHVLVTSRERLQLRREALLQVPPLSPAAAETLIRAVARRRGVRDLQNESGVRSLLKELDGLPLAVELAGARLRTRSAADLARAIAGGRPLRARERDRPDRHASMAAVVESSLERLPPELQVAIHDLTVFQGLFDIESAARALGIDVDDADEMIEVLVDSSMLHFEEQDGAVAYRILRPTHTVLLRLRGIPTAARDRLVLHYDALGRLDPVRALGRDRGALLRTLRPHALDLAALSDEVALRKPGFALLSLLVFHIIGMGAVEQRVAKAILSHSTPTDDLHALGIALACKILSEVDRLGTLLAQMSDTGSPEARLVRLYRLQKRVPGELSIEHAARNLLADARQSNDHFVMGRVSALLGGILVERNALDEAEEIFQSYLTAATIDQNLDNRISAWSSLARVAFARGDSAEAIRRLQSALGVAGTQHRYAGVLLGNTGLVHLGRGDMEAAEETTLEGLELARRHGNLAQVILSFGVLSDIYLELERHDEAMGVAQQAYDLAMEHLTQPMETDRTWAHLSMHHCIQRNFPEARAIQERWHARFGPSLSSLSRAVLAPVEAWIQAGLGHHDEALAMLQTDPAVPVVWKPGLEWMASEVALEVGDLDRATACIDRVESLVRESGAGALVLRRSRRTRERIEAMRESTADSDFSGAALLGRTGDPVS